MLVGKSNIKLDKLEQAGGNSLYAIVLTEFEAIQDDDVFARLSKLSSPLMLESLVPATESVWSLLRTLYCPIQSVILCELFS